MDFVGAAAHMASRKKQKAGTSPKAKKTRVGRPKAKVPLLPLISLKGSLGLRGWVDRLVKHSHQGNRALLMRNSLREFAENHGFEEEMPER